MAKYVLYISLQTEVGWGKSPHCESGTYQRTPYETECVLDLGSRWYANQDPEGDVWCGCQDSPYHI